MQSFTALSVTEEYKLFTAFHSVQSDPEASRLSYESTKQNTVITTLQQIGLLADPIIVPTAIPRPNST
jgi:hypothetical protein